MRGERGAVLGFAMMAAFVASIVAYLILQLATSQARHAQFYRNHASARYASEYGLVWARQQLLVDPNFCVANQTLPLNGMTVTVNVTNCAPPHTITSQVTY